MLRQKGDDLKKGRPLPHHRVYWHGTVVLMPVLLPVFHLL